MIFHQTNYTMKKQFFVHPFFSSAVLAALLFAGGCSAPANEQVAAAVNPDFAIAAPEFSDLAVKSFDLLSKFEFDAWGEMLAGDIEYYFPDGDVDTRTKLAGKQAVLDWWKNWQETSGIQSMVMSNGNYVPVEAIKAPNMTGLPGVYVFCYMSNAMDFNGNKTAVRMNFSLHFNQEKLIDRIYSYYDRMPIVEAMGRNNILDADSE